MWLMKKICFDQDKGGKGVGFDKKSINELEKDLEEIENNLTTKFYQNVETDIEGILKQVKSIDKQNSKEMRKTNFAISHSDSSIKEILSNNPPKTHIDKEERRNSTPNKGHERG